MTLSDFLESKADYILHNSIRDVEDITREKLIDKKDVILNLLKEGLRKLAQAHDRSFFGYKPGERYKRTFFTGYVQIPLEKRRDAVTVYDLKIKFPNWSLVKIMVEDANKDFEEIFKYVSEVFTRDLPVGIIEYAGELNVYGTFIEHDYPNYSLASLLISNPLINKLSKYDLLRVPKKATLATLHDYYTSLLKNHVENIRTFGDFSLMPIDDIYLQYIYAAIKYLLIPVKQRQEGIGVTGLREKEYYALMEVIEDIKKTKNIEDTNILLKDVMTRYLNLKIKEE